MALKATNKTFPTKIKKLDKVIEDFVAHFEAKKYKVNVDETADGAFISITDANIFKTISGLKTGLNITLSLMEDELLVKMEVGIFGKQVVPTIITALILWPVLITQIIGIVKQNKLDKEAYQVIEDSLRVHEEEEANDGGFCPFCGAPLAKGAKFCPSCGKQVEVPSLENKCPDCGAEVNPDNKFCPNCGHKF